MNLVSRKSLDLALSSHLADSIWIANFARPYFRSRAFDIGTGAGFPGIVFSILYPECSLTLLERSTKKQTFLSDTIEKLKLKAKLQSELPASKTSGLFFGRAVYPIDELFPYLSKHLESGSVFVLNVGGKTGLPSSFPRGYELKAQQEYELPEGCGKRIVAAINCFT